MATNIIKPDEKEAALSTRLADLKAKVEAMVVASDDDYRNVVALRLEGQNYIKSVGFELDPGIASAKQHWEFLKGRKERLTAPAEVIVEAAKKKAADWNERKRLEAEAQTRRENEERRLKAEREAAELKRIADEKAAQERKEREVKAEEERKVAQQKAEEDRKTAERQIEIDRKKREQELKDAREQGLINKREQDRLAKQAAEQAERDKKAAEEKAIADKKAADEKAERDRLQAIEDEKRRKEEADRNAQAVKDNVKEVKVLSTHVPISGIRGGGSWIVESLDEDVLLDAYAKAGVTRRIELRPFVCANSQEIARKVRVDIKDKEKAEALIPGIVVKFKDR